MYGILLSQMAVIYSHSHNDGGRVALRVVGGSWRMTTWLMFMHVCAYVYIYMYAFSPLRCLEPAAVHLNVVAMALTSLLLQLLHTLF